ncbi:AraC family transcriptional regulator [Microbacterium sp. JB110]|uniref:AraC family transcriptional regulator n=1 Tax=Microbacterium sp. JB110 TaxID=2024477 RepID=UPI000B34B5C4|nr:helix-turn-helix domain-containing protein [Microbacterium sp. JB110]RCS62109.1 AraC family transcriptional regulator [Microbacterium sp. JB110]
MLIWAHTGRAHVRLASGQHHRIDEGTGLWLPAGIDHELWTEPGSLAIPAWVSPQASPGAPRDPTPFVVAEEWRDWLIHHYVLNIGPMTSVGYAPASLLDILSPSNSTFPLLPRSGNSSGYPPLPRSMGARTVAQHLLRNPTFDHTVEEWSKIVSTSARTLRREFLRDTDLTFTEWRTRCRLAVAREFLATGFDIEQAAVHSGFRSRNGLTRAFRNSFNVTPREYARQFVSGDARSSSRVASIRQIDTLLGVMADAPAMQPVLPAAVTAPRVNDFHVLVWSYRGDAWARVDGKPYSRKRGDVIWLPSGMENETGWPAGSLGVPVGDLQSDEAQIKRPLRTHFPPAWDTYMLHCSVSAYTGLRPENYDRRHILELFDIQLTAERLRVVPMPSDPQALAVAEAFVRHIDKKYASRDWDVPREVREAFRRETGMTFSNWRHATRMRVARDLLLTGTKASAVAHRVGYSQLSNFSRDFRRSHHMSPREFQEQQT